MHQVQTVDQTEACVSSYEFYWWTQSASARGTVPVQLHIHSVIGLVVPHLEEWSKNFYIVHPAVVHQTFSFLEGVVWGRD